MATTDELQQRHRWAAEELEKRRFDHRMARYLSGDGKPGSAAKVYLDLHKATSPGRVAVGGNKCLSVDTEVLSDHGWVGPDGLKIGDLIYTLNPNGFMEWKTVEDIYRKPYHGRMVKMSRWSQQKGTTFSALVTPDHRWPVVQGSGRDGRLRIHTTDELNTGDFILRAAPPGWDRIECFSDDFIKLVGWVLTEGSMNVRKWPLRAGGMGVGYYPRVCQAKEPYRTEIRTLLSRLDCAGKEHVKRGTMTSDWNITGAWGREIADLLGPDKRCPMSFILALSRRQLRLFYEILLDGDGFRCDHHIVFVQGRLNRHISDLFQTVCVLLGKAIRTKEVHGGIADGSLRTSVQITGHFQPRLGVGTLTREPVEYDGEVVWCPSTENGTLVARREGTVYITGNSGKSTWGVVESYWWATGQHPFRETPKPPTYGRIVCPELPLSSVDPHPQINLFKEWFPLHVLRGGSWEEAYSVRGCTLHLANGSMIEFVSSKQDAQAQAGASHLAWLWGDEEIDRVHLTENRLRLDRPGAGYWLTFAPLGVEPYLEDEIVIPAMKGELPDVTLVQVSMLDNAHNLPAEYIRQVMASLMPSDLERRVYGRYATREGLVFDIPVATFDFDREFGGAEWRPPDPEVG